MWYVSTTNLQMVEGDYGIALPITINGTTLGATDSIKLTFKDSVNGSVILEKTYSGIAGNTVNLEFTAEESELFSVGSYVYCLDWFQSGSFMCNIVPFSAFKVVEKA